MSIKECKVFYIFLILVSAVSFFSCKNFLDGNQELQELQKAVDYANAPYVKVKFDCNPEALQVMVPSAGEVNDKYKVGDIISLDFEVTDRYQFIKWIATPSSSVSFSDPSQKITTATILDSSSPITISQECVIRPKIIGISPSMGAKNINPFEIIKVTFDHPMDDSSIYWTYNELVEEITKQGKNVDDYLLVKAEGRKNAAGEEYYYCYRPKAEIQEQSYINHFLSYDFEQVFFKNIKISTKRDGKNKLCLFACPFFNDGSKTVLNIVPTVYGCSYTTQKPLTIDSPAQNQSLEQQYKNINGDLDDPENLKDDYIKVTDTAYYTTQPLGNNVEVYVELGSGFCYEYGSEKIKVNGGESWIYQTSVATAYLTEVPSIKQFHVNIWNANTKGNVIHAINDPKLELIKDEQGDLRKKLNVIDKKLLITGEVEHSLHGLNKVTWELYAYKNEKWTYVGSENLSVSREGDKSYLNTILDLSDYIPDNSEGAYYLNFTIYDNNGKFVKNSESADVDTVTDFAFYYNDLT